MNQDHDFEIDYRSGSATQSSEEMALEEAKLYPEELFSYEIDSEDYSSGKPRRITIRARIIHDQNK